MAALFYALAHLFLYTWDLKFDVVRVALEIVQRFYLTIGFVALLGLVALGSTSTDAAIRRLGSNWGRLHRIVYVIGVLAAFHFFIQSKADVYEPTLMAGLFVLLMLYRLAHWRGFDLKSPLVLVGLACLAGAGDGRHRICLVRACHRHSARPRACRKPAVRLLDPAVLVGAGGRACRRARSPLRAPISASRTPRRQPAGRAGGCLTSG